MFDFALITGEHARRPLAHDLAAFAAYEPEQVLRYSVGRGAGAVSVAAFYWESHPVHRMSDRLRIGENGFACLAGYPLDENMKPIRTVDRFDPDRAGDYDGDFFYLSVNETGECRVAKSPVCSYPLYHARGDGRDVLASRAMLAAVAAFDTNTPPPNIDFARWICTYGGGGNLDALFEGSREVLWNQSLRVADGRVEVGALDYRFLEDEPMAALHARAPDRYWDEVYDYLLSWMSVLEFSDKPIEFPLSGGKDSRLLLGLIVASGGRGRLERVFTNGPAISPDVRAAEMVCTALGLDHEFVDRTSVVEERHFRMDHLVLPHIHTTEGEMSLHDLTHRGRPADIVQLHGLESGLRNIAGLRDFPDRGKLLWWYGIHLAKGDKCEVYADGYAQANLDDTRDFIDAALAAGVLPEQIPTLHRVLLRSGRWVSRTWRAYNDRFFAPYIFANHHLLKAAYNCGAAARGREEFHYQMLRRISPELIDIPFAEQEWLPELAARHDVPRHPPLAWPEGTRPQMQRNTHLALYRSFDEVRQFLLAHEGHVTSRLLDREKLARFEIDGKHPSIYLAFLNIVQIAALELAPDLETLVSGLSGPDVGLPSFDF